jgi:hypothetical protein
MAIRTNKDGSSPFNPIEFMKIMIDIIIVTILSNPYRAILIGVVAMQKDILTSSEQGDQGIETCSGT